MIINLTKIPNSGLEIEQECILAKELYQNASIEEIQNLYVKGKISYDYENNLIIELNVKGIFILKDVLSLEPIEYPFSCEIEEKIENIEEYCGNFYEKSKNTLDISEILWENIVLEIPISATKTSREDFNLKGNGWEMREEEKEKIDPRLAKLTELLDEGKE